MITTIDGRDRRGAASRVPRRRMLRPGERPLFVADWADVLFVHFAVDPAALRPHVPFDLDTHHGRAYVSLVAFTQRRPRPRIGGRLAAILSRPLAEHEFLNVRTYVRVGRSRGIYFLAEWVPNRLAALVGPATYGLPYRLGRHCYACRTLNGNRARYAAEVVAPAGDVRVRARFRAGAAGCPARRGLERFLLERYTAYTVRRGAPFRFRVWHEPWRRVRAAATVGDRTLLDAAFPWLRNVPVACAHYSRGVRDVWIGPPRRVGRPGTSNVATWAPPAVFLGAALSLHDRVAPWAWMWAICFALFFGCKWLTWRRTPVARRANVTRSLGYLFAWVGMDASGFLDPSRRPALPLAREWLGAAIRTAAGAALLWACVRRIPARHELIGGWVGMTGLVLMLHFGAFHLLSAGWRAAGVYGPPIMRSPVLARSVGEFWGARWNRAFHDLATELVFRPLRRRTGAATAVLATFAVSGVVHELVISLPAGGGFGPPTAYFAIQGAALLLERSRIGWRFGLGRGAVGRFFAVASVVAPLPWLFHPTFVRSVIVPFLHAVGAR